MINHLIPRSVSKALLFTYLNKELLITLIQLYTKTNKNKIPLNYFYKLSYNIIKSYLIF